ncbi:ABC-three component system protein [Alteromonas sp. BMJM2]|uniref:ABC-three component system protein n=1 Tax=Alteromonas sp. BMJM2 TaxID=2954241 RepID=UPI0022B2D369|nr:ABC-three component system protein [Alteromonas sp. BMJM2]
MVQVPPHTAISSCSGYIYQGKIALMHCLKLMENLGNDARSFKLEIESLDDFAIKNLDGSYRSMHQVKAKKATRFSSYSGAFDDQRDTAQQKGIAEAYFHVAKEIEDLPDDYEDDYDPVKLYQYKSSQGNESSFCQLDEVDTWNNQQVAKTYRTLGQPEYKYTDSSYIEKTRLILEDLIIKHIIHVHHKIIECKNPAITDRHIAQLSDISFDSFFEVMVVQNMNSIDSEEYFHWFLIKKIGEYFNDFCIEEVEAGKLAEEDDKLVILNNYLSHINILDVADLRTFIQGVMPHRKASFRSLDELVDNTINSEDFRYGLLEVFKELIRAEVNYKSPTDPLFFWSKNSELYYPTAITLGNSLSEKLCTDIVRNSLDQSVDFLYESGSLITSDITKGSIFSTLAIGAFSENEEQDSMKHHKINEAKKISLISLNDAKGIIND